MAAEKITILSVIPSALGVPTDVDAAGRALQLGYSINEPGWITPRELLDVIKSGMVAQRLNKTRHPDITLSGN